MDALETDDRVRAIRLSPAEKLAQALEMMRAGIRLKRSALHRQFPGADQAELDRRLVEWLRSEG